MNKSILEFPKDQQKNQEAYPFCKACREHIQKTDFPLTFITAKHLLYNKPYEQGTD
jgi:hypothetical protein